MTHVSLEVDHTVKARHLYDMSAIAHAPLRTASPLGLRSTSLVSEGTITGERIRGRMLPGGGDWMLLDAERVGRIDARYAIETDDGEIIQTTYNGRLVFHGNALERLRAGEPLTPDDYLVRIAPTFEAPAAYNWLNHVQAIGIGTIEPGPAGAAAVRYTVLELL
jgi:hypothetical protein